MSESNKVPIQATPEQQASMAASGLVGSLFTPGAAAGTHGSSQGHGTTPTSEGCLSALLLHSGGRMNISLHYGEETK